MDGFLYPLQKQNSMNYKIGCSGFSYKDWVGFFYPDDLSNTKWLEYYTTYFDTVELNSTFYKTPGLKFLKNLYKRTPPDFCFVVKAPKLITHTNRFASSEKIISHFYKIVKNGLQEKLGAVLFQCPPSFAYAEQHMQLILNSLDTSFLNVVEFRHKSWWNKSVYKKLGDANITFCGVSYSGLPDDVIINTSTPYYRFHGVPKLYYSMYSESFLNNVAQAFLKNKKVKKGFFLFNNTATRAALENAGYLQEFFFSLIKVPN
jgi:uncharacterized protein YecE (DUF72 family)